MTVETLPSLRQERMGRENVYFLEDPRAYRKLCEHFKREGYDFPQCLSGVDMEYGLRSVLHLRRLRDHSEVTVCIDVPYDAPKVPSVTDLWGGLEWHEREAYDLLGIHYDGHPDLRRILLEDHWTTHPLQRRYDTGGYLIPDWRPKPWPDPEAIARKKREAEATAQKAKEAKEVARKPAEAPAATAELTGVKGLNANYAGKLKEQEIADVAALAGLPDERLGPLALALGLKTPVPLQRWCEGARALLAESGKASPAPKPHAEAKPAVPVQEDDLTRIEGVSKDDEAKLKARGIKTFARIAKLNDKAAEKYANELGFGRRPFEEGWREQAAKLMKETS
ncbi:hypothetical protein BH24DEI1_BH24DEI1_13400 [soil metagenome]